MSPSKSLCRCLICLKEIVFSDSRPRFKQSQNQKLKRNLCQRFCVIMSRYLNSKPSFFSKLENTLNLNNQEDVDQDELSKFEQILCCDECEKWLKSICEIYHEWTSLQLKLNAEIRSLAELMMMESSKGIFNNQEMKIPECEKNGQTSEFREMYLERVIDKKAVHDFPHLSLEKCEFPPKLIAEPEPEVYLVKTEVTNSDQDEDWDGSTTSMDVDMNIEEEHHYASNKIVKVEVHEHDDDDDDDMEAEAAEFENTDDEAKESDDTKTPDQVASSWICDKCGKKCLTKSGFLKHQKVHSGGSKQPSQSQSQFVCDTCGKWYRDRDCFSKHQAACYKGESTVRVPRKTKDTTVQLRESVFKAWEDSNRKKSFRDLAVQFKLPKSTVFSIIQRYKQRGAFTNKIRCAGNRKLTEEQHREILAKVRKDPNINYDKLRNYLEKKYGTVVTTKTVRNYIRRGQQK